MRLWRDTGEAMTESLAGQPSWSEENRDPSEMYTPRAIAHIFCIMSDFRQLEREDRTWGEGSQWFDDADHVLEVAVTAVEMCYQLASHEAHTDDEWEALLGRFADFLNSAAARQ